MKRLLLTAAVLAAFATVPATAKDFTGPYVGLSAGYEWGEIDYSYEDGTTGFGVSVR